MIDMWKQELDREVIKAIQSLNEHEEKVSIRKIAKIIDRLSSLRSVQLAIERLIKEGFLLREEGGDIKTQNNNYSSSTKTRGIPLLWTIACGWPILAEENIEAYIPIGVDIAREVYDYFLLRATWDSMNWKWINEGDMLFIRQQNTASNGDIVVALIDDSATLKEFQIWEGVVRLIPHSSNKIHKPIIVTEDLIIQGKFEKNLGKF